MRVKPEVFALVVLLVIIWIGSGSGLHHVGVPLQLAILVSFLFTVMTAVMLGSLQLSSRISQQDPQDLDRQHRILQEMRKERCSDN